MGTSLRRIERTLLIDADDTLWENNIYYLRCAALFQSYMASLGCDPQTAATALRACEREVIPEHGYGPQGYVIALGMACRLCLEGMGLRAGAGMVARAEACGQLALAPPMVLLPGVRDALRRLQPSSRLLLVTKGDIATQRDKIARSGLGALFDDRYIVPEKDAALYRRIVAEQSLRPRSAWMVGNSPRSDINPAVEAGLRAVLIPHDHTWTAEHETVLRPEEVVTLGRFPDLLPFFGLDPLP